MFSPELSSGVSWMESGGEGGFPVDEELEDRLKMEARPLLMSGRGGDWEHTQRAVGYGRYLLARGEGDEDIVIPALYLHDIGWSQVDFHDFVNASPPEKDKAESLRLHMEIGARLARGILGRLGCDPERIEAVAAIIAVHDNQEKVFAMADPSAILVAEADKLDRYGPGSLERFNSMFGKDPALMERHREKGRAYLREGLETWFKTRTARDLAERLGRQTGLLV